MATNQTRTRTLTELCPTMAGRIRKLRLKGFPVVDHADRVVDDEHMGEAELIKRQNPPMQQRQGTQGAMTSVRARLEALCAPYGVKFTARPAVPVAGYAETAGAFARLR